MPTRPIASLATKKPALRSDFPVATAATTVAPSATPVTTNAATLPQPKQGPSLPPELRQSLRARIGAVLADPRAARCTEPCPICDGLPTMVAEAVLARWDVLALAGVWPVKESRICAELREHGIPVVYMRLQRLLKHRRWTVLTKLVRADIEAWQRSLHQEKLEA